MSDKYEQNQKVYFRLGEGKPEGWGLVEGVQGFVVIVRPLFTIPDYKYSCIYVVDSQIGNPPAEVAEEKAVA